MTNDRLHMLPLAVAAALATATLTACSVRPLQLEGKTCTASHQCEDGQTCRTGLCSVSCNTTEVACGTKCCTVQQLVAGGNHTCALHSGGGVACWGDNASGQLGDGTRQNRSRPTAVSGLETDVVQIAAGNAFTCAVKSGGQALCWGDNSQGQLGDGTTAARETAQPLNLPQVTSIGTGFDHTCAIVQGGGLWCWGSAKYGQVGLDVRPDERLTGPTAAVPLGKAVQSVSLGNFHSCALLVDGSVSCWGYNKDGELGNGTMDYPSVGFHPTPSAVVGMAEGAVMLSVRKGHSCVVTPDHTLKCWGDNFYGSLGLEHDDRVASATLVSLSPDARFVGLGDNHTCAVNSAGAVSCSGNNSHGQLGNQQSVSKYSSPVAVLGLAGPAASIAGGTEHTCALLADRRIQCWGNNNSGQLGDGSSSTQRSPVTVVFP